MALHDNVWSGTVGNSCKINFTWKFNWDTLKSQGVNKITGYIYVSSFYNWFTATKIDVTLTENNHEITKQVQGQKYGHDVSFECSLTPHYEIPSYDKMFEPSDQNDTILIVDGKKLHLTKQVPGQKHRPDVSFEFYLTPQYEIPSSDKRFEPSDQNDSILIVDGKKLHVSKWRDELTRGYIKKHEFEKKDFCQPQKYGKFS
ncbi:hypothetical protein CRE_12128 [Caenorhabditis remanei]|uniref:Uncharacterized protein n=1 Tax=Caenorhabditis remanei TaxID=31234 RepID=E3MQ09_CAERE|nr:hypothetical protein CRE_12128 [Caenorhabditis remanei]